jgi:hypothetical protein
MSTIVDITSNVNLKLQINSKRIETVLTLRPYQESVGLRINLLRKMHFGQISLATTS